MIRIVIADDHTIVREGLKQLLAAAPGLIVAAEAGGGAEVLQRVRENDFDVLLLDMSMPGRSGIELIKQVRDEQPKLRILVLSMHQEPQYAVRAIRAGAAGYLTKDSASAQLVSAIRTVAEGGMFVSPELAGHFVLDALAGTAGPPHTGLSDREYQVFEMLINGASVSAVADRLSLSVKTVSTHKANILRKMNLNSEFELIRYAISHRLIDDATDLP